MGSGSAVPQNEISSSHRTLRLGPVRRASQSSSTGGTSRPRARSGPDSHSLTPRAKRASDAQYPLPAARVSSQTPPSEVLEKTKLEAEITALRKDLVAAQEIINARDERIVRFRKDDKRLKEHVADRQNTLRASTQRIDTLKSENGSIRESLDSQARSVERLQISLSAQAELVAQLQADNNSLRALLDRSDQCSEAEVIQACAELNEKIAWAARAVADAWEASTSEDDHANRARNTTGSELPAYLRTALGDTMLGALQYSRRDTLFNAENIVREALQAWAVSYADYLLDLFCCGLDYRENDVLRKIYRSMQSKGASNEVRS